MRRSLIISILSLGACLVISGGSGVSASAAASTRVIYADTADPRADDSNPGTASEPVKTIGQAVVLASEYNARSIPVRVIVRPGVYRESLAMFGDERSTPAPITIEGAEEGVIVSGSDVWTDWVAGSGGILTHPWTEKWGLAPFPDGWDDTTQAYLDRNPVIRRREMVFLGGRSLLQVMSLEELKTTQNSFFVSEADGEISISVPSPGDIAGMDVEVATRPYLLQVGSRQNVTVKNITFQHAATPMPGSAVSFADSSKVAVIHCSFVWNSWSGLSLFQDEDVTIRDVTANHNGVSGITGTRDSGLLIADSQTSYNNWRGSRGWDLEDHGSAIDPNFIDFATGQKFFSLRHARFDHLRAIGNLTGGIWLDYDNADVSFEHVVLSGNLTHGLMIEASQGPVSVEDSEICGNETGILSNNSSDVRVVGNVLAGNLLGQLFLAGAAGPRPVVEYDTGSELAVKAEHWVVRGNDVSVDGGGPATGTYLGTDLWNAYIETLDSDQNRYSSPGSAAIFGTPGGLVDLEEWRVETGTDQASTFTKSTEGCRPVAGSSGTQAAESPRPGPGSATSGGVGRWMNDWLALSGAGVAAAALLAYVIFRRRRRRRAAW